MASPQAEASAPGKFELDGFGREAKGISRGKNKLCCGYPIVGEREWALRFYWVAEENRFTTDSETVDLYTPEGFFLGEFASSFARALLMEGTGRLGDGRVINYAGRCKYGVGICYATMGKSHRYGRGAGIRPLVPFVSVAVDPRFVAIGDPMYVPEFDGVEMPDGSIHDGCVRADDTGGNIKRQKLDFFVESRANWLAIQPKIWGGTWITPRIEEPRCEYLR